MQSQFVQTENSNKPDSIALRHTKYSVPRELVSVFVCIIGTSLRLILDVLYSVYFANFNAISSYNIHPTLNHLCFQTFFCEVMLQQSIPFKSTLF